LFWLGQILRMEYNGRIVPRYVASNPAPDNHASTTVAKLTGLKRLIKDCIEIATLQD